MIHYLLRGPAGFTPALPDETVPKGKPHVACVKGGGEVDAELCRPADSRARPRNIGAAIWGNSLGTLAGMAEREPREPGLIVLIDPKMFVIAP